MIETKPTPLNALVTHLEKLTPRIKSMAHQIHSPSKMRKEMDDDATAVADAFLILHAIAFLTADRDDSLEIHADEETAMITVFGDWTDLQLIEVERDTLADCLISACAMKEKALNGEGAPKSTQGIRLRCTRKQFDEFAKKFALDATVDSQFRYAVIGLLSKFTEALFETDFTK